MTRITVGVLALQGAFYEHFKLLRKATDSLKSTTWKFIEIRTPEELSTCDALIIPGGESTTVALVASRSGLLEPLRDFVKVKRKPTWGTCAGLILLAETANRVMKGGQELIGGLDVRVNRNYFGRQTESFEAEIGLHFLDGQTNSDSRPFRGLFIRAPVVESILKPGPKDQVTETAKENTVTAPAQDLSDLGAQPVEIMARLPGRSQAFKNRTVDLSLDDEIGDIVAVRQRNCFATSFHPELTNDARIHTWWLMQVQTFVSEAGKTVERR